MELALFVYLASVAGNIGSLLTLLSAFFALALGMVAFYRMVERYKVFDKMFTSFFVGWLIVTSLIAFIPSEKTMYLMAGAYTGQKVYESEAGQTAVKIVNEKLKAYLEEQTKEKK